MWENKTEKKNQYASLRAVTELIHNVTVVLTLSRHDNNIHHSLDYFRREDQLWHNSFDMNQHFTFTEQQSHPE